MLSFDLGKPAAAELSDLSVGEFFIYESSNEPAVLAVVLSPLRDDEKVHILQLEGSEAFRMRTHERRYREHVVRLGLNDSRIKLRIDMTTAAKNRGQHELGQLLFGSSMSVAFATSYHDIASDRYCNVVSPKEWQVHSVHEPRFRYDTWALSYLDDAGLWVDLVRREAVSQ